MLEFLKKRLDALLEERSALKSEADQIVATAQTEKRDKLNDTEQPRFDELLESIKAKDDEIDEQRARIKDAEDAEARSAKVAESRAQTGAQATERGNEGGATVTSEPATYRRGGEHSYFRDLTAIGINGAGATQARERLQRNNREVEVETRALTTTDGAGGEFVPPVWMVNQYIELARAARPTADRVNNQPLPSGTDSFSLPKLATGTAVAEQTTQNTAVQNTDATTSSVTLNVKTLAGQQVVAVQLIEQSPVNMDEILLADLAADYATKVDVFVLDNNATGAKGLLQESGTNAITYTSGSPTVALLYSQIANAVQSVASNRFLPPDTIVMSPRRWAYLLAASDSAGRPLILPSGTQGPFNAIGTGNFVQNVQGVVGNIAGLDVIVDPSIPTNLGAGTNQDPIVVFRASDSILYEGTPRSEAFRETKADQLSVLLRFYNYVAFTTARYAKSVSVINGTGLVAPTF